jgi:hypothetical protein
VNVYLISTDLIESELFCDIINKDYTEVLVRENKKNFGEMLSCTPYRCEIKGIEEKSIVVPVRGGVLSVAICSNLWFSESEQKVELWCCCEQGSTIEK